MTTYDAWKTTEPEPTDDAPPPEFTRGWCTSCGHYGELDTLGVCDACAAWADDRAPEDER